MQFFETGPEVRRRVLQWLVQMPILLILASCGQKGESNMPTAETLPVTDYEVLLAQFEEELAAAQEAADVNPSDGTRFYAAQVRTNVGLCLDALARRDEAIAELVRAAWELRVLPDTLDGKSDTLGACADGLGLAYHGAGEHELAEASFVEAIEHRVAANNGMATVSKIHLGNLYLSMSRYSQARSRLEEALAEARDPEVIVLCHSALGRYFHTVGSYAEALDQHGEAEIAARKLWGEDSGQVAGIHSDQASALFRSGRYLEARDRYMAVLDYYETLDDIAGIAAVLNNLANVDLQRGDPESAAAHFQRAIDLRVETGRADDPEILTSLSGLGYLHLWNRNVEEAGLVFEEAEKRALDLLGENHPLTIEIRQGIGYIALALGNRIDALKRAEQAFSSGRQLMLEALKTGTEEQQIDYRKKIDLMSLTCAIGDPELIAERLLLAQGLVSGSKLDEVSSGSVPVGTATVAYIRFFEYDTSGEWTARYGAVVSGADKPSVWCRLATDEQLAALVDALFAHMAFEQAMGDGKKPPVPLRKLEPTLRRLHELIWKPVADRLSTDTDHLAVCPDGIVSAIPFAALMDGDQFLCEGPLSLSFFSLLRDAMIEPKAPEPGPSLAFGISVFGANPTDAMSSASPPYSRSLIHALSEMGDLPGVAREMEALRGVFGSAGDSIKTLVDTSTGEAGLRSHLRGAHILHFASHAFVLPREPGEPAGTRPSLDRTSSLERTGLVVGRIDSLMDDLKNGHLPDQEDDNILFTKEVAGLPLDETWLVTLSACSTGRGDPVSGEGVIGLQRGFFTAGVQHVAMTLWPLSDNYAPDFMAKFYSKVFAMNRPDAAMWQTQRDELVRLRNAGGRLGTAVWLAGPWTVSSQRRSW